MDRKRLEFKGSIFEGYLATIIKDKLPNAKVIMNKEIYSPFLGKKTQIDLIIVTDYNVYIVEAKNWSTYIKGSYEDTYWKGKGASQVMTIFSPINQNAIHSRALRLALYNKGYKELKSFKSLIVVPNECQLLTNCKEVCVLSELQKVIEGHDSNTGTIDKDFYFQIIDEV